MNDIIAKKANGLFNAILTLESVEDCEAFFSDICTIQELEALTQRLDVAKMLLDGKNYNEISQEIGVSTATICRVGKCVKYGDGGYEKVLSRLNKEEEK